MEANDLRPAMQHGVRARPKSKLEYITEVAIGTSCSDAARHAIDNPKNLGLRKLGRGSVMRAFLLGFLILLLWTPFVAGQATYGITNQGNLQDYPTVAVANPYYCTVRWYVDNPTRADLIATITLRDLTRGMQLGSQQYLIPRQSGRADDLTTFKVTVPAPMAEWKLEVDIVVLPKGAPSITLLPSMTTYAWNVDAEAIPEFPHTATMALFVSLTVALVVAAAWNAHKTLNPLKITHSY
jgi:hypothetical protein